MLIFFCTFNNANLWQLLLFMTMVFEIQNQIPLFSVMFITAAIGNGLHTLLQCIGEPGLFNPVVLVL